MKSFLASFISFLILDLIWLGFVVKNFNLSERQFIGRISDNKFDILYLPALMTYILMALAVSVFVVPKIQNSSNYFVVFSYGALMGLVVYGVFDMTNLSILKNYPVLFSIVDISWGIVVFGLVSIIVKKFQFN